MNIKKEVLNTLGICEICGNAFQYNAAHDMTGQLKTEAEHHICPNCKTQEALKKFHEENKDEENKV